MVDATRHLPAIAALEAGRPALVFASLGIALALHGAAQHQRTLWRYTLRAPDTPRYEEQDLDVLLHDLDRRRAPVTVMEAYRDVAVSRLLDWPAVMMSSTSRYLIYN